MAVNEGDIATCQDLKEVALIIERANDDACRVTQKLAQQSNDALGLRCAIQARERLYLEELNEKLDLLKENIGRLKEEVNRHAGYHPLMRTGSESIRRRHHQPKQDDSGIHSTPSDQLRPPTQETGVPKDDQQLLCLTDLPDYLQAQLSTLDSTNA